MSNETASDLRRTITPMEQWLLKELAKTSDGILKCQVLWAFGQASNGDLRATDIPGIYTMRCEGQDQRGARHVIDRIFAAETILMVDLPQAQRIHPVILPVG